MDSRYILINQVAQGLAPWSQLELAMHGAYAWVLSQTHMMVSQAHPVSSDWLAGASVMGVSSKSSVVSLFSANHLDLAIQKLERMPERDRWLAVKLLVGVLGVADKRRRLNKCKGSCSHWWHRDLSDPAVLEVLLRDPG